MPNDKERTIYVAIDTQDMNELEVYVFDTAKAAREWTLSLFDGRGMTDEAGEPVEPALKAWKGKADLDVWEHEGRVCMTLKAKKVLGGGSLLSRMR